MTEPEFWEWYSDYAAAFPGVDAKLGAIKDDANPKGEATLKHWLKAFADVELDDAKEVTNQMVMGEIAVIRDFELGTTAAVVRKHAREIFYQRTAKPEEAPWRNHERRFERGKQIVGASSVMQEPGMRAALEELLAMKAAGESRKEQQAMLRERFPEDPTDRRERFFCRTCRDLGLVRVWSERAMRAYTDNKLDDRKNRTTATIPCECERGRKKVNLQRGDKRQPFWTRCFDPRLDCACTDPDDLDAINDLEAWCEEKKNEKPANYESSFDEYNRDNGV